MAKLVNLIKLFLFLVFFNNIFASNLKHFISDFLFAFQNGLPKNSYHKYCKNIYSLNGEDGILEQILKELEIKNGTFCELSISDGIDGNCVYNLIKNYNFSGIAIKENKLIYELCIKNYQQFNNIRVFHDSNYNLDTLLKKENFPNDFDVLVINVNGEDYNIWENLKNFKPKIIILNTNCYRDPIYEELNGKPNTEYNQDLLKEYKPEKIAIGCSFISGVKLGLKKEYIPIAYTKNIIFLRKDLVNKLKELPRKISNNPYDYIDLYSQFTLIGNTWKTNSLSLLNVAIRDYYIKFDKKYIDIDWINIRTQLLLNNDIEELVTNGYLNDGFGSQFHNIIASIFYAEINYKKFIYTPFKSMEHNYEFDRDFLAKKEKLINLIDNFEINNSFSTKCAPGKSFLDSNMNKFEISNTLKNVKKIFRDNKDVNNFFKNKNFNIVVHIRRLNKIDCNDIRAKISDEIYLKIIEDLRKIYSSKDILFHIHSQGCIKNFQKFKAKDIFLHLNETVEDAFNAMVFADVLVIGTSSLSYTAGLLSDGIVYYIPFWHKPMSYWKKIELL